ncbi:hypothetical protein EWF37_20045 [Salmonella enterica subsp. enterica]|nr:hypothetical protein [Salmonella enterica subsp. enterica]ECJ5012874.1 hypothetical protein [Salmonella enterica subsp. enterica]
MPNHVTNEIRVVGGTNKQRLAFIRAITNKFGLIDFNNICKRPKSMDIEESGAVEAMATAIAGYPMSNFYFGEVKTPKEVELDLIQRGTTQKYLRKIKAHALLRIENKRRYGFYSWYDWSRANWGTKWNAYSVEMPIKRLKQRIKYGHEHRKTHVRAYAKRLFKKRLARHAISGGDLVIRFDTAWNCPEPVYHVLASRFPHLEFIVHYADEDIGSNCGSIVLRGGKWDSEDIAPPYSEQSPEEKLKWRKFAFELCHPGATPQEYNMDENYEYLNE